MFKGTKIRDLVVDSWHNARPEDFEEGDFLFDFWSYSCSNCRKRAKLLEEIDKKFDELEVVGIHTPEFDFEKDIGNFVKALENLEIDYPVAHDREAEVRASFGGVSSQVLVKDGKIVWKTNAFSELEEAFSKVLGKELNLDHEKSKEVQLGFTNERLNGEGFRGEKRLEMPSGRMEGKVYGSGKWRQEENYVEAVEDARLFLRSPGDFQAVLHPGEGVRDVEVLVDGRKVREEEAGKDLRVEEERSYLRVKRPDLYNVLEADEDIEITLLPEPGTKVYSVAFDEV